MGPALLSSASQGRTTDSLQVASDGAVKRSGERLLDGPRVGISMSASYGHGQRGVSDSRMRHRRFVGTAAAVCLLICCSFWAGRFSLDKVPCPTSTAGPGDATEYRVNTTEINNAAGAKRPTWKGAQLNQGGKGPHGRRCQTILFFHIPKTGGESLNSLWKVLEPKRNKDWRLPGWKEYNVGQIRVTPLTHKKQLGLLRNMWVIRVVVLWCFTSHRFESFDFAIAEQYAIIGVMFVPLHEEAYYRSHRLLFSFPGEVKLGFRRPDGTQQSTQRKR